MYMYMCMYMEKTFYSYNDFKIQAGQIEHTALNKEAF